MRFVKLLAAIALFGATTLVHALETAPYSAKALSEAQAAGKPVAVWFHASWCPTCRAQEATIKSLKTEPGLDVTVLVADYDTEKALKQRFRVTNQSTFVVMRGEKETARIVGDSNIDHLRTALKSPL